jgi:hypothetical protein
MMATQFMSSFWVCIPIFKCQVGLNDGEFHKDESMHKGLLVYNE